jgi:hypothetical protein
MLRLCPQALCKEVRKLGMKDEIESLKGVLPSEWETLDIDNLSQARERLIPLANRSRRASGSVEAEII